MQDAFRNCDIVEIVEGLFSGKIGFPLALPEFTFFVFLLPL